MYILPFLAIRFSFRSHSHTPSSHSSAAPFIHISHVSRSTRSHLAVCYRNAGSGENWEKPSRASTGNNTQRGVFLFSRNWILCFLVPFFKAFYYICFSFSLISHSPLSLAFPYSKFHATPLLFQKNHFHTHFLSESCTQRVDSSHVNGYMR